MTSDCRQRAEAFLSASTDVPPAVPPADGQNLVHELQVHQIELETQNEALRQAQSELAHSRDSYADLYNFAPVGYLTLDHDGVILEANNTAATLFGVGRGNLLHCKFSDFVQYDAQDEWYRRRRVLSASNVSQTVELGLHTADATPFIARLECRPRPTENGKDWHCLLALSDITERKQTEVALQHLNEDLEHRVDERTAELRVLVSRLADAQEAERRRIAEGLHDEVCQLLAASQLKLAEARDSTDIERRNQLVDAADRILNEASDEVRGLTFELSAASLFDGGFAAAARDLCAYMTESHNVKFEVNCANEDLGIPERLRPTLYHSLRELLHNVVRHAGVDHATVWIEETVVGEEVKTDNRQPSADQHLIRVTVSDYGKGFNTMDMNRPLTRKGGFGLRHLRERMLDIGGTMRIESVPGEGTKAVLEVPVG